MGVFNMNPNTTTLNQNNLELYKKTQQEVLLNHEQNVHTYLEKIDTVNRLLMQLEKSQSEKLNKFKNKYEDDLKSNEQAFQKSQKTIFKANDQKQNELLSSHRNIQKKNQNHIDKLNDQLTKLNYDYERFDGKAKDLFQAEEKQIQKNKNKIKRILADVSSNYYLKIDSLTKDIQSLKSDLTNRRSTNIKTIKQILAKNRKLSTDSLSKEFTSIIQLESSYFKKFDHDMSILKRRIKDLDDAYSKRLEIMNQNIDKIDHDVKSFESIVVDEYQTTYDLNNQLQLETNNHLSQLKKQETYLNIISKQVSQIKQKSIDLLKKQVDRAKSWVNHTDLFYLNLEQELRYSYENHQEILSKTLEKTSEYQSLIDAIQLAKTDNLLTNPIWLVQLENIFITAYEKTEKGYASVFEKLISKIEILKTEYQKIDEIEMILSFEETYKNDDFLAYKIENTKQEFIYSFAIEKSKIEHEINQYSIIKSIEDKRLELMNKSLQLELERQINDIKYIKSIQDEKVKFDYLINTSEAVLNHELGTIEHKKQKSIFESEIFKLNQDWIKVSQLNAVVYRYETKKIDIQDHLEKELNQIDFSLKNSTLKLNLINQERDFKIENERQDYYAQKEALIEPHQKEMVILQAQVDELDANMITEIRKVDHLLEESLAVPRRFVESYQVQKQKLGFVFSKLHDEAEMLAEQPFSKDLSSKALNLIHQMRGILNENFETIDEDNENSTSLYRAYELIKSKLNVILKGLDKDFTHLYDSGKHPKLLNKLCEQITAIGTMSTSIYENTLQNIQKDIKETVEARNFSVNQIQKNQSETRMPLILKIKDLKDKIESIGQKFDDTLANVIDVVKTYYEHKINEVNKEIQLLKDIRIKVETEVDARFAKLESIFNTETAEINQLIENKNKDIDLDLRNQLSYLEQQIADVTSQFKESIIKSETDYKMNSNRAEKLLQQQTNQILKEILSLEKSMIQIDADYQKETTKASICLRNTLEDLEHQNSVNKNAYEAKSVLFKQAFEQKMLLKRREIEQIFEFKEKCLDDLIVELNFEMTQVMNAYKDIIKNHATKLLESLLAQYINQAHFNDQMDKTASILTIERS